MEPRWDSMVLHPALLIASGIECIDSRDVRFLNAYRRFSDYKIPSGKQFIVLSEKDFQLGGIMNPNDLFIIPHHAFAQYKSSYIHFPCLTKNQIFQLVYVERLREIFENIVSEISMEIIKWKDFENIDSLFRIMKDGRAGTLYSKIVALHLCGFGEKLKDAFYLLLQYSLETNR